MSTTASVPSTPSFLGRAMKQKRFVFGATVTLLVIAFAVLGPLFAPYGEEETAGSPYAKDGLFGTDYVELARLKGIPEPVVMRKHALLNAIVPGIQVIALQLAWLAGGVVLVETLFAYPGVGRQLVDSVRNHDVPMVQALSMIIAGVYIVVNLVADVLSILLTPRARTAISS